MADHLKLGSQWLLALTACGGAPPPEPALAAGATARWCAELPRPANLAVPVVPVTSDWFEVRQVDEGVYAFLEPGQFQETISYLIVGTDRALMFDTGLGLVPIRPVAGQLTNLPIEVLNSHTHYDHVGGNAEFDRILAVETPYTRANQAGFPHSEVAAEVADGSFCEGAPRGADTAAFRTQPWQPSRLVADGDTIDLGGRVMTVFRVPGHTPDAIALFDRDRGLLWTGDTYYDATIWLYVPETDFDEYDRSLSRLIALGPSVRRLLPAHNTVSADPGRLGLALDAFRQVRAGTIKGQAESGRRAVFRFPHFAFLTSEPLLEGVKGDQTRGGSGLTIWP